MASQQSTGGKQQPTKQLPLFPDGSGAIWDDLVKVLEQVIHAHAFDNSFTLHPRHFGEIAASIADGFSQAISGTEETADIARGRSLAARGVGFRSLVAVLESLGTFAAGELAANPNRSATALYLTAQRYGLRLMEGFTESREREILDQQEQLRRALSTALDQQRLELLIKNHALRTASNGIALTDMEGTITYANPALLAMCGYDDADSVVGETVSQLWEGQRDNDIFDHLEEHPGWRDEIAGKRVDGTSFPAELTASLISDGAGHPVGTMALVVDITLRKRLEAQVRQSQKMEAVGQLAGGIAHDFNNILTGIMGYVQLLSLDAAAGSPMRHDLDQVRQAAERGAELTSQLKVFTRHESGERRCLWVNDIVKETHTIVTHTFPPDILAELNLDPELKAIVGDATQMSQLVMNLCVNARDAMVAEKAGGRGTRHALVVRTLNLKIDTESARLHLNAKPGPYVLIRVEDTGIGIAPEAIDRIFEPFFTTKGERTGTGLGLAVVYGIVQNHRGFIEVESRPSGGTAFDVYLPAVETDCEDVGATRANTTVPRGEGTVLVIDDEEQVRDIIRRSLERAGFSPVTAEDGPRGLAIFRERHDTIRAVVLDMVMPRMSGRECLRLLREIDPDIPILISTGYTFDGSSEELLEEGATAIIEKPLDIEKLIISIDRALND